MFFIFNASSIDKQNTVRGCVKLTFFIFGGRLVGARMLVGKWTFWQIHWWANKNCVSWGQIFFASGETIHTLIH